MRKFSMMAAVLAVGFSLAACGNSNQAAKNSVADGVQKNEPSIAAKIATIDAGQFIPNVENSTSTQRVQKALGKASETCNTPEHEIGNIAATVSKVIRDEGHSSQIVELLEMLPSLTVSGWKMDCTKVLTQYAAIRHSGMNHPDALIGLRRLLDALK